MYRRAIVLLAGSVLGIVALVWALPSVLRALGLHRRYAGESFSLEDRRALIVTTSHGVLNAADGSGGRRTGVFASEMTAPYYEFVDAGMRVDLASIEGGEIPVDPTSLLYGIKSPADERYLHDPVFQSKVRNSLRIDDVDMAQYDVVFIAGGWGAAYDLGYSEALGQKVSEAFYGDKEPILGAVCHGALGFTQARTPEGGLLIEGRRITAVTNKQIKELGIGITPQHPETELRRAGVSYESQRAWSDVFANHVVVDDEQRIVTGQNQNAGHEAAQRIMEILAKR